MVGKPSRVPYLKGGFEVEGLPEDFAFSEAFHVWQDANEENS